MADAADKLTRVEMRFSGSGGQGILLAAAIIAEAATAQGKQVVSTQSYGPAARGGASKAEVIDPKDPQAAMKSLRLARQKAIPMSVFQDLNAEQKKILAAL